MSDTGQIIDPYRVAPATGGIEDILAMAAQQRNVEQQFKQNALGEATRNYLRQQMGIEGFADPMAVQGFNGEEQKQKIAGAQEGRMAQQFQQLQDFTKNFMGAAKEKYGKDEDAFVQTLLQSGASPETAKMMSQYLGQRSEQKNLLDTRVKMNDADNIAAAERNRAELANRSNIVGSELKQRNQFEIDKEQRGVLRDQQLMSQSEKAIQDYINTGDTGYLVKIDPRLASNEVVNIRLDEAKRLVDSKKASANTEAETKKVAEQAAKLASDASGLTPEQMQQIKLERVKAAMGDKSVEDYARRVAAQTQRLGGASKEALDDIRATHPQVYDAAWNQLMEQKRAALFAQQLEAARSTPEKRAQETARKMPGQQNLRF